MEWGIKLKSNREDLFKKRFWTLVGKMIISFTIIAVFFILLKRIIELSDFQWLYDIDSVSYYRSIETFNKLYYNGTVYIVVATLAIIIFLILLYKEIKHMTSYINIISDSSEKLFDGSEEYIDLPPEMKELEVKLNHFRSESIKNKKSAEENEKKMLHIEAIIQSMTQEERRKPSIIGASRKVRISKGSGTRVQDVNQLLKQFEQMQKMMKQLSGGRQAKMLKRLRKRK